LANSVVTRSRSAGPWRTTDPRTRYLITRAFDGRCAECSKPVINVPKFDVVVLDSDRLEVDHVVPHSKGGANHFRNFRATCKTCNKARSNRPLSASSAFRATSVNAWLTDEVANDLLPPEFDAFAEELLVRVQRCQIHTWHVLDSWDYDRCFEQHVPQIQTEVGVSTGGEWFGAFGHSWRLVNAKLRDSDLWRDLDEMSRRALLVNFPRCCSDPLHAERLLQTASNTEELQAQRECWDTCEHGLIPTSQTGVSGIRVRTKEHIASDIWASLVEVGLVGFKPIARLLAQRNWGDQILHAQSAMLKSSTAAQRTELLALLKRATSQLEAERAIANFVARSIRKERPRHSVDFA
jgi:HNH endonuclease